MPQSGAAPESWATSGSDSGPTATGDHAEPHGSERWPRHGLLRLSTILGLAALYLVFGQASFSAQFSNGIVTPACFIPEGIALSAAILLGPWVWPGIFIGQLILAGSQSLPLAAALAIAAINSLEAVAGSLLFRRLGLRADLSRLQDLVGLQLLIVLVLQPFSASFGTATLWLSGSLQGNHALMTAWLDWWVGNWMGQSLVTPLLLGLVHGRRRWARNSLLPLLSFVVMVPAAWLTFRVITSQSTSVLLVIFTPILVGLAIGPGLSSVSAGSLGLTITALAMTQRGLGPFISAGKVDILDLNLFVLGLGLTGQVLAVLLNERKQMEQQLRQLAYHDALTQLPNRRLFYERLDQALRRSHGGRSFGALIMLDLDQFKEVNDQHGHDAGDQLLIEVADRLRQCVPPDGLASRLGGDEFVVLLEGLGQERPLARQQASAVAETIRQRLGEPYVFGALEHHCSASYGLKLFPVEGLEGDQILKEADLAMYDAKKRLQAQAGQG